MNFVPNVPAKVFSGSAVVVGYLLIEDLTANEQNALGNWLMLAAQVLCTNAFYQQVQQERFAKGNNFNNNGSNSNNNNSNSNNNLRNEVEMLKKVVNALNKEINELERSI